MSGRRLIRRGIGAAATIATLAAAATLVPFPGRHDEQAASAPVEGDPTFGGGAPVLVPFAASLSTSGDAVAGAPDGGVYVAGATDAGDIVVAHLAPSGLLDPAFGVDGIGTIDLGSTSDGVTDLAVGPDGAIFLAGSRTTDGNEDVAVARLGPTGALDAAFGTGGLAVVDLGGDDVARSLAVDAAGRAVVLADTSSGARVLRLTTAGLPDAGFDGDGVAGPPLGGAADGPGALAVGADGGVFVAGSAPAPGFDGSQRTVMAVGRLTAAGAVDGAFGFGGVSRVDSFETRTGRATAVAVRADGALWLAGTSRPDFGGNEQPSLLLVSAAGQVSGLFGQQAAFGDLGDGTVEAVFPTDAGAIVALRTATSYVLYARNASGGAIDGYGTSGVGNLTLGDVSAVTLGAGATIVATGSQGGAAVVGRLTTGGLPDAGFGSGGTATVAMATARNASAAAVSVLPGGKVLIAADLGGPDGGVGLVRLLPDGSRDDTFGAVDGMTTIGSFPTWAPYAGHLVSQLVNLVGGYALMTAGPELVRLDPSGDIDGSFGKFGRFVGCNACRLSTVALGPDQQATTAGIDGDGVVTIARATTDGFADESLANTGSVTLPWLFGGEARIAVLADRRTVVAGPSGPTSEGIVITRLQADGTPDPSFAGGAGARSGLGVTGPKEVLGIVASDSGTVLVVTRVGNRVVLARFTDGGTLDGTFGPASPTPGIVVHEVPGLFDAGSMATDGAGKVFVAGTVDRSGGRDGAIFRFGADGSHETALAVGGPGTFGLRSNDAGIGVALAPGGEAVGIGTAIVDGKGTTGVAVRRFRAGANSAPPDPDTTAVPSLPNTSGRFHALSPARVLDTRTGVGAAQARVGPGGSVDVTVIGHGGVPGSGVGAVALSVIAVGPTAPTYITIHPAGELTPLASNLNALPGTVVNNMVAAKVGVGGAVRLFNAAGTVDLVADVVGWFDDGSRSDGAQFHPLGPARVLDTREAIGAPEAAVGVNGLVDLTVTGVGGVPDSGVSAVVLNVGVTQPSAATYITAFPSGEAVPATSNLNVDRGATISRLVIAKLGANGKVTLYNAAGSVHLVADVVGWFDGAVASPTTAFTGLTPVRLLDTRDGTGAPAPGPVQAGQTIHLAVAGRGGVPGNGATAVVVNVTATDVVAGGYLTVFPGGDAVPYAASVNTTGGVTTSNLVVAKLGTDGSIDIFNAAGTASVVVDVVGWFS